MITDPIIDSQIAAHEDHQEQPLWSSALVAVAADTAKVFELALLTEHLAFTFPINQGVRTQLERWPERAPVTPGVYVVTFIVHVLEGVFDDDGESAFELRDITARAITKAEMQLWCNPSCQFVLAANRVMFGEE